MPQRRCAHLGRCLAEGFAYQGEPSAHRDGARAASRARICRRRVRDVPAEPRPGRQPRVRRAPRACWPTRGALRAAIACCCSRRRRRCCSWARSSRASTPFLFFCDFGPELAAAVTRGTAPRVRALRPLPRRRRRKQPIPDPNAPTTFDVSKLDWQRDRSRRRTRVARALSRAACVCAPSTSCPRLAGHGILAARFAIERDERC